VIDVPTIQGWVDKLGFESTLDHHASGELFQIDESHPFHL